MVVADECHALAALSLGKRPGSSFKVGRWVLAFQNNLLPACLPYKSSLYLQDKSSSFLHNVGTCLSNYITSSSRSQTVFTVTTTVTSDHAKCLQQAGFSVVTVADHFQVNIMQGFRCILILKYSTVLLDWNLSVVLLFQTASSLPDHSYPVAWLEGQN